MALDYRVNIEISPFEEISKLGVGHACGSDAATTTRSLNDNLA
jgi:hypothetical protein